MTVLGYVLDNRLARFLGVTELLQGPRNGLVDNLHRAATNQLLELDQREVWLDSGGVAVHHEADRSSGRDHRGLSVAVTVCLTDLDHAIPRSRGAFADIGVQRADGPQRVIGCLVLTHHSLVGTGVTRETLVRSNDAGKLGRTAVGDSGHERRDRRSEATPAVGVVTVSGSHQQRPEIGVADAELTVVAGGAGD